MLFHLRVQPQVLPSIILTSFFSYSFSTLYLSDEGSQAGGGTENGKRSSSVLMSVNNTTLHRGTQHRLRGLLPSNWDRSKGDCLRNCNSTLRGKSQLCLSSTEVRAGHWQQPAEHLPREQIRKGRYNITECVSKWRERHQPETAPAWKK